MGKGKSGLSRETSEEEREREETQGRGKARKKWNIREFHYEIDSPAAPTLCMHCLYMQRQAGYFVVIIQRPFFLSFFLFRVCAFCEEFVFASFLSIVIILTVNL